MKVYNAEGKSMNADKEQMKILFEAGWSTKKPEVKADKVTEVSEVSENVIKPIKLPKKVLKKQ